jgi:hypothetical protein
MVWDTIHGRGDSVEPIKEWGGIAYALAALEVSLPSDWEMVPLIKVGHDLASRANDFLTSLTKRSGAGRFIEVHEANNRVTIRYVDAARRAERLSGGVPPWQWEELGPLIRDLDAIYVNFISGFEMGLDTAQHLRHGFHGPMYADLHSLMLGVTRDGLRVPRRLPDVAKWFACFDAVQMNEDELHLIGDDPMAVAATAPPQCSRASGSSSSPLAIRDPCISRPAMRTFGAPGRPPVAPANRSSRLASRPRQRTSWTRPGAVTSLEAP